MYRVYRNQAAAACWSLYFSFFFLSSFQTLKFFVTLFSGTVRPRSLELYTGIMLLFLFVLLFLHFSFSPIFTHYKFSSHPSEELWDLEGWNFVHPWKVGRCIVYTWIRLLLHICPFIFSVFFLSNFPTLTFFVTFFSGTVRSWRLKLGTHVDSGQMYCVYQNQAATAYSFLYFFIFLSLQFPNITSYRHTFLRNCEA